MSIPNMFSKIKFTLFDNNTATIKDDNKSSPEKTLTIKRHTLNQIIDYHTFGVHAYLKFKDISKVIPIEGTRDKDSNTYNITLRLSDNVMKHWIDRYNSCDIPRCRISLNKVVTHEDGDNADYAKDYTKYFPLYITVIHVIMHCKDTHKQSVDDIKAEVKGFLTNTPDTLRVTGLVFNRLYRNYDDLTRRVFEIIKETPVSKAKISSICGTLNPFDPEDDYNQFSHNVKSLCEEINFGDISRMNGGADYFRSEPFNSIKALMFKNLYQLMVLDAILALFKENEMMIYRESPNEDINRLICEYDALTRITSVVNKLSEKIGLPYISSGEISNKAPYISVDSSNGCCLFETSY